jgi:hypothetical protein
VWRSQQPGLDEQLDAHRFGIWLDVLLDCGASVAAEKLAGVDIELVVAAVAQHVLVFDRAAVSPFTTTDGQEIGAGRSASDALACDIGDYVVESRLAESWDTISALLRLLDDEHHDYFQRLMRGCRSLSNSTPEADGFHDLLTDADQDMFDLAFDRERRRETQGYVTPAQARAFLQMARQLHLKGDTAPPRNPLAVAHFRATEWTAAVNEDASHASLRLPAASTPEAAAIDSAAAIGAVVDVLVEAGVLPQHPRALLGGADGTAPRLAGIQTHMQFVRLCDLAAYSTRTEEIAYLANAIVAGCSIQARAFTVEEASDATVAVCNLGLENWPVHWAAEGPGRIPPAVDAGTNLPEDFLSHHDLISVFQVGWTVLYTNVAMHAAEQLIQFLTKVRHSDRQTQASIDALRIELARHWRDGTPWHARDALDVILLLDMPAWAALLGLIAECPVLHGAIAASSGSRTRAVSASAFEFISDNHQIAAVHQFVESLPAALRG